LLLLSVDAFIIVRFYFLSTGDYSDLKPISLACFFYLKFLVDLSILFIHLFTKFYMHNPILLSDLSS
jgi:hypothetical protein